MLIPALDTPRLMLRPLGLADAGAVQALFPRWEIVRFLTARVPWPYPADGALSHIRDHVLPAMAAGREWHWTLRWRALPDMPLGIVSLMDAPLDSRGFWLDPVWQGRGLMAEACDATAAFWFDTLGRDVLHEPKAVANEPSRRVSRRTGMTVVERGLRDYVSGRQPGEIWQMTQSEWRRRQRTAPTTVHFR